MDKIKIQTRRLRALLTEMVNHYSPSGREEELSRFLADYLTDRGLEVVRRPVDETRVNLEIGSGKAAPETLFLGHIDTVPAFDLEEYQFRESRGRCYGLGTADMKGGCAAMIEAFVAAFESGHLPSSVLLALVVGEEESGDGTAALLEHHRFNQALVAEPTSLRPCPDHYGYVEMLIRVYGYRRHAAMGGSENDAVRSLLRLLLRLEDRIDTEPSTILNIRDLHSSESGFAVPDQCAAALDLHIPPGTKAAEYAASLKSFAEEFLSLGKAPRFEIEFPTLADGFSLPENPLIESLEGIYHELKMDFHPAAFRSHSDANLLIDAGCRPLILGPGNLSLAHTIDESVKFAEVEQAATIYGALLQRLA